MRVLDLFSGIGGFSLGLERAGMETVAFCEFDDKCRQVLKKHWPDVPIYNDVRTLTKEQLDDDGIRNIGLICGGYPCQPFSTAGKRQGAEDDRNLWPAIHRIVKEIRPYWCVFENVYGHISMGLDNVLADLEALNYEWWAGVVPACAVGASHRRDRIFIIAHYDAERRAQRIDECCWQPHIEGALFWDNRSIQSKNTDAFERAYSKPELDRVIYGVPGGVDRLEQLGNTIIPQIPEVIGRAIIEVEKHDQNRN